MSCKHLVYGWRGTKLNPETGKPGVIYKDPLRIHGETAVRPCGNCIDCRLNYSRIWAIRCTHEAAMHEKNCVVTLTYANENLPKTGSIEPKHAETFMKDLRAYYNYHNNKTGIRSYGCAEYGCNDPRCGRAWCGHNMRPHYHIILFNHDFEDKKETKPGYQTSDILDRIWKKGGTQIMDLTWETAAYVARYVMKKTERKRRVQTRTKKNRKRVATTPVRRKTKRTIHMHQPKSRHSKSMVRQTQTRPNKQRHNNNKRTKHKTTTVLQQTNRNRKPRKIPKNKGKKKTRNKNIHRQNRQRKETRKPHKQLRQKVETTSTRTVHGSKNKPAHQRTER